MGLAAPRRRTKIAHDPRNLAWSGATDSYGQRLMQQQGWKSGEALGARGRGSNYSDAEASRVRVNYKDDTLGLGANLKSKDAANSRTGFDAFAGLLGRLNAKTEAEVAEVEKKIEDKKLAMFAQGKWGGMVFVPGGILVQSDPYKMLVASKTREKKQVEEGNAATASSIDDPATTPDVDDKAKRKAEKKARKEEKRLRKEQKQLKKSKKSKSNSAQTGLPSPDSSNATEDETADQKEPTEKKSRKRARSPEPKAPIETKPTPEASTRAEPQNLAAREALRNGRHILRGRNIQAKRAAFSDMKGLDEIFMKKSMKES